jgi:hypothetical protein
MIPRQPYPSFSLVVYCAFLPAPEPVPEPVTVFEDVPLVQPWDGEDVLMVCPSISCTQFKNYLVSYEFSKR